MISECLKQILSARFGKDVRQSIHDGIKEIDGIARTAQGSATLSAQKAIEKANEALTASQAAIESAKQAKAYADNAQAVAGVSVATQDTAGLVKGGENHIGLDGTLELVVKTTEASMPNSRKGGLLVDEIGGACVQDNIPSMDYSQEIKCVKGKNLLDCRGLTEQTINGVTFTPVYDSNGNLLHVEANGTATANATFNLNDFSFIKNAEYIISDGISDSGYLKYCASILSYDVWGRHVPTANGSASFVADSSASIEVVLIVYSGITVTNLRFYPMIRKASITDSTYVPYGLLRVKIHGKNLFDYGKSVNGYITNDGVFTYNSYVMLSDYMTSNGNVTVSVNKTVSAIAINCFDSNKKFISKNIYESVNTKNTKSTIINLKAL